MVGIEKPAPSLVTPWGPTPHGSLRMLHSLRSSLSAAFLVMSLNARNHAAWRTPADIKPEVYRRQKAVLARIQASIPEIRFLYTFRIVDSKTLQFVLNTGTIPEESSALGDLYTDLTPELLASFSAPFQPRADREFSTDQRGTWQSGYAPLLAEDGTLEAVLGIDFSAQSVMDYQGEYLFLIGFSCLTVGLAGALAGFLISRRIGRPLRRLADDRPLVRRLILHDRGAVPGTERARLGLFFSDLEGFTAACETLDLPLFSEFLSDDFQAMNQALHEHKAIVDKFIGDSIMAFGNAPPEPFGNHALAACQAAFACQNALRGVWARSRDRGVPPMRTRIGIHTGESLVGNVGYPDRLNYTALGDAVNGASRIEGLNKFYGTRALISEATWLEVSGRVTCRLTDWAALKRGSQEVAVYGLLGGTESDPSTRRTAQAS